MCRIPTELDSAWTEPPMLECDTTRKAAALRDNVVNDSCRNRADHLWQFASSADHAPAWLPRIRRQRGKRNERLVLAIRWRFRSEHLGTPDADDDDRLHLQVESGWLWWSAATPQESVRPVPCLRPWGILPQPPAAELGAAYLITSSERATSSSRKKTIEQFVPVDTVKTGDISQNGCQRAHAQRVVIRNRDMVLRWIVCGQPKMCPCLPGDLVSQCLKGVGKLLSG